MLPSLSILRSFLIGLAALVAVFSAQAAEAVTVVGPFGSNGSYTLIPNGGFESGSMMSFYDQYASKGVFRARTDQPYLGSYSARSEAAYNFNGPGFAAYSGLISVTPGQTYVLSGFFYTGGLASGNLYLDLNDASFDVHVGGPVGVSEWQFAYGQFVPNTPSFRVRLVRDGNVQTGQYGFIDEVAVTPLASFVPASEAQPVPEPGTLLLLGSALAGVGALARRRRRQR